MMKKITFLLVFFGMIALQSCTINNDDEVDNDTISEVFEVTRSFGPQNEFSSLVALNPPIFASDVVLVYMLWDVDNNGEPIWRLMPQTVQLLEGDLQYNYDFTRFDVNLFLSSLDFNLAILGPEWTQNQTFRIVIVPGFFSNRVDYRDYNAVMNHLGLTEADVKKIN
jgi:hypothetical protein